MHELVGVSVSGLLLVYVPQRIMTATSVTFVTPLSQLELILGLPYSPGADRENRTHDLPLRTAALRSYSYILTTFQERSDRHPFLVDNLELREHFLGRELSLNLWKGNPEAVSPQHMEHHESMTRWTAVKVTVPSAWMLADRNS